MKMHISKFLILIFFLSVPKIFAQEVDIVQYLKMIEQGKVEEAKSKLLDLKTDYPKSSNLIFLEGVLTENGQDAIVLYQSLVEKYPKSAYADAALYRIYSYYFALGLYNTADKNLNKLKNDYPDSPYLKIAASNVAQDDIEETNQQTTQTSVEDTKIDNKLFYSVQAGAFTNAANANLLKKDIENAGMISFLQEKNVAGTVFNVVFIGKFNTRKEADDFLPIANTRFKITGRVVEITK